MEERSGLGDSRTAMAPIVCEKKGGIRASASHKDQPRGVAWARPYASEYRGI